MGSILTTVIAIATIPIEAYQKWKKKQAKKAAIKKAKKEALEKEKERWSNWRADRLKIGEENHAKNTAAIIEKAKQDINEVDENPYE
ncbi:MAG: hypothetical protein ACTSPB_04115 [Candidatus Thorarchaeota archaeon]